MSAPERAEVARHLQPRRLAQRPREFRGHAIGEVLLAGIAADILYREHGQGTRAAGCARSGAAASAPGIEEYRCHDKQQGQCAEGRWSEASSGSLRCCMHRRSTAARGADRVECAHQLLRALWAVGRTLCEAAHHQVGERLWDVRSTTADALWFFCEVRREHRLRRPAAEGGLPRDQLIRQDAPRVHVSAMIHARVGACLFASHVGGRAECDAHRCHAGGAIGRGIDRLGHAKVRDHRAATGEQHVVGLDVAVHDAVFVRVRECACNLAQQSHRLGERQLAFTRQPGAE